MDIADELKGEKDLTEVIKLLVDYLARGYRTINMYSTIEAYEAQGEEGYISSGDVFKAELD